MSGDRRSAFDGPSGSGSGGQLVFERRLDVAERHGAMHLVARITVSIDTLQLAGDRRQKSFKNYRMAA
ncbi:MAG: hypothetical protein Q8R82_19410 [Hyphomonadaceae bacterium]|nr:hypothetical protein [Hyphomonadaceae bacterium]